MSLTREELDEIAAGSRDMARITKAQHDAFLEVGFNESQALKLTAEWLRAQVGRASE